MLKPTLDIEKSLWESGYQLIAGLDEVGRGAFAGPVVVAAVVLPKNFKQPPDLADSKLLKPRQREKLSVIIKKTAVCYSTVEISVEVINQVGIGKATQMAFYKAIRNLESNVEYFLIDAFYVKNITKKKQKAIIKGDLKCTSIAAASIIAKVHRDQIMKRHHRQFPQYGFAQHKGYGTKKHQLAIKEFGLTSLHRKHFIHFL